MTRRLIEIAVISAAFFVLDFGIAFCLLLAAVLILFYIVDELLRRGKESYRAAGIFFALSWILCLISYALATDSTTLILQGIFTVLIILDAFISGRSRSNK